jgi:hypothetical protein
MEKTIYVLDSNYRREPELAIWLSKPQNFVALTDTSAIEIHKGNEPAGMLWSLSVLKNYADKVIVLKTNQEVVRMSVIEKGLRRRLISHPDTLQYPAYCQAAEQMESNPFVYAQVLQKQQWANEEIDRMRAGLSDYAASIRDLTNEFPLQERKLLKGDGPYPRALALKILDAVSRLAIDQQRRANPKATRFIGPIYNLLAFRYALCAFLLALRKVADGGNVSPNIDKVVNDDYDMSYCAYATYFDGLFTKDQQPMSIYLEACTILRGIKRAISR